MSLHSPLHPLLAPFQFRSYPPARSGWNRIQSVRISPGDATKEQVIRQYARDLRFPAWSGENWDAFEESLRSYGTVTQEKKTPEKKTQENGSRPLKVRIWHGGCPLAGAPADLLTYCEILHDLVTIPHDSGVRFEVLFRKSDRDVMNQLLHEMPG